jgi:hypothetical protein
MAGGADHSAQRLHWGKVQTQGHAFNVDKQAILEGSAPGGSHPQDPDPFVGENIGRHTVLCSQGNQGQSLPPNDRSWGLPSRLL